ncbi:cholecystokinin receptor type A-like [Lytechinus pictus]|uniref:cholecystokinin receptor type A-like n=1 Tax=Lytechinus pictus TaxID=7653 RepID=UPI00240E8526|nr:cholecystokinin receptor type A-like [Lytechinus pictus]
MNLSSPSSIYAVIFYSLQIIFGIPGNVLIVLVYIRKKRKVSTDILIIAQGIIDLVASLLASVNILKSISDRFTIKAICRITLFGNNSLAFSSLFLTAAIALDRFFFVCRPYGKRTSNNRALCLAVACWVLGSSLTCTKLIYVEAVPSISGQKTCLVIDTLQIFDKLEAWLKTSGFVLALVVSSVMYGKIYHTIRHQAKIHAQLVGGVSKKVTTPKIAFRTQEELIQTETDACHSTLEQSMVASGEPSDKQEAITMERCPQSSKTSFLQVNGRAKERDPMTPNSLSSAFDGQATSQVTFTNSHSNSIPVNSRQNSHLKLSDRGENRTTKMLMAVTAILLASWLPPIVFFHLRDSTLDIIERSVTAGTLVFIGMGLPGINHIINYFVYTFMNKRFRVDCKCLLKTITHRFY